MSLTTGHCRCNIIICGAEESFPFRDHHGQATNLYSGSAGIDCGFFASLSGPTDAQWYEEKKKNSTKEISNYLNTKTLLVLFRYRLGTTGGKNE